MNEVMTDEQRAVIMRDDRAELSVDDVINQVGKIQTLMKSVMKKDEHYGVIPGTQKPTLLKAGAEKLGFIFRLVPKFDIKRSDFEKGHREYEIIASLYHQQTDVFVAQGVGSCSTMETKYRYRHEEKPTGQKVPKEYWDLKDSNFKKAKELIGGNGFKVSKVNGNWEIVSRLRIENPDIADVYNTVLKMAKKRAHIDAMITACAASDIFTQDLEDLEVTATAPPKANGTEKPDEDPETLWNACVVILDDMLDAKLVTKSYVDKYLAYMQERHGNSKLLTEDKAGLLETQEKRKAAKELKDQKKEAPPESTPDLPTDENTSDKELEIF